MNEAHKTHLGIHTRFFSSKNSDSAVCLFIYFIKTSLETYEKNHVSLFTPRIFDHNYLFSGWFLVDPVVQISREKNKPKKQKPKNALDVLKQTGKKNENV